MRKTYTSVKLFKQFCYILDAAINYVLYVLLSMQISKCTCGRIPLRKIHKNTVAYSIYRLNNLVGEEDYCFECC